MRQLKRSEYQSRHVTDDIQITIGYSGVIAINHNLMSLMKLQNGDRCVITCDDDGDYFIGRAADQTDNEGFVCRNSNKNSGSKTIQFNAAAVIKEIIENKDLALSKDKKKSMRFDVSDEAIKWNGTSLYEIKI